jgi:hypothetical protein
LRGEGVDKLNDEILNFIYASTSKIDKIYEKINLNLAVDTGLKNLCAKTKKACLITND